MKAGCSGTVTFQGELMGELCETVSHDVTLSFLFSLFLLEADMLRTLSLSLPSPQPGTLALLPQTELISEGEMAYCDFIPCSLPSHLWGPATVDVSSLLRQASTALVCFLRSSGSSQVPSSPSCLIMKPFPCPACPSSHTHSTLSTIEPITYLLD